MKHINKIAIKILTEEYEDYSENDQKYNQQYSMIVKALTEQLEIQKHGEIVSIEHDGLFTITTRGVQ